jgi:hypothetical protein
VVLDRRGYLAQADSPTDERTDATGGDEFAQT